MIFTKEDVSTSDEQVEKFTMEYNIHYIACIGSLIYSLYTRVDLSFAVHKLANLSENPGKVHLERLVHILIYIRDNKTLCLKYYADLNDAQVSDLLRKASIKTKNHLNAFSDSSWQDFQTLEEVQDNALFYIKVGQFTMAHMFQDQLLNPV